MRQEGFIAIGIQETNVNSRNGDLRIKLGRRRHHQRNQLNNQLMIFTARDAKGIRSGHSLDEAKRVEEDEDRHTTIAARITIMLSR